MCGDVIKNAWEAVTRKAGMPLAGEVVACSSIQNLINEASVIVPGHDTPFVLNADGVEFLGPFRWEIKISPYPERPERTVSDLYRPAGQSQI